MDFVFDNDKPIYIQLVEQFKIYIISGKIKPGGKMLSVRELALVLHINPNTVQKALGELEDDGIIFTERTNGKYVTSNIEKIDKLRDSFIKSKFDKFLSDMELIGFDSNSVLNYLKRNGGNL